MNNTLQCSVCNRTLEESDDEKLVGIDCSEIFGTDCDGRMQVI